MQVLPVFGFFLCGANPSISLSTLYQYNYAVSGHEVGCHGFVRHFSDVAVEQLSVYSCILYNSRLRSNCFRFSQERSDIAANPNAVGPGKQKD